MLSQRRGRAALLRGGGSPVDDHDGNRTTQQTLGRICACCFLSKRGFRSPCRCTALQLTVASTCKDSSWTLHSCEKRHMLHAHFTTSKRKLKCAQNSVDRWISIFVHFFQTRALFHSPFRRWNVVFREHNQATKRRIKTVGTNKRLQPN